MNRQHKAAVLVIALIFAGIFMTGCGKKKAAPASETAPAQPASQTEAQAEAPAEGKTAGQAAVPKPKYDYWQGDNEVYQATYEALYRVFGESRDSGGTLKMDWYFPYISRNEYPMIRFPQDEGDAALVGEALAAAWTGEEVPTFIIIGNLENAAAKLKELDCASISLRFELEEDEALPAELSAVSNLKTLDISMKDHGDRFDTANLVPMESVEDLTLFGTEVLDESLLWNVPNLRKLTLIRSSRGNIPENMEILAEFPDLAEVCISGYTRKNTYERPLFLFVYGLRNLEQLERINGVPKNEFASGLDEEAEKKYLAEIQKSEADVLSAEAEVFLRPLYELVADVRTDQGTPHVGERVLAAKLRSYTSRDLFNSTTTAALTESAYAGVPHERLAARPEEADTVIILYFIEEKTGQIYTNHAEACRTYTMVATIDLTDNNAFATHLIGVTDPPEVTYGNSKTVGGKPLWDEAAEYVAGLFAE